MPVRKIIEINEELCTGCGLCVVDCAEGALQIVKGKAKVVRDSFCDGLGACIGACPEGALTIIERDADAFDEEAVAEHLETLKQPEPRSENMACGCPGSMIRTFEPPRVAPAAQDAPTSALTQWPVQLRLLPTTGPLYQDRDLMVIADCVAVADPDLHRRLIAGNTILITCPKLDNGSESIAKLAEIFKNPLRSIGVAIMEVPCCSGLLSIVREAARLAGRSGDMEFVQIGLRGGLLRRERLSLR